MKELSAESDFKYLLGIKNIEKRMKDVELVLRFADFYHFTYLQYKPPMKKFLNLEMEKYQSISQAEADDLRNAFKNTLSIIKSLIDKLAFKRFY